MNKEGCRPGEKKVGDACVPEGTVIRIPHMMPTHIKSPTKLLTKEILKKIPPLYSTEKKKPEDIPVHIHYFSPYSGWDWYITEFDGKDIMYGLVRGLDTELGYVSLSELKRMGMNIERDRYFGKHTLKEIMEKTRYPHGGK